MKYQSFKREFEFSGKTQKEYAKQKGISPSMVSYYLRKAREEQDAVLKLDKPQEIFQSVELIQEKQSGTLRLDLPNGIVMTLTL